MLRLVAAAVITCLAVSHPGAQGTKPAAGQPVQFAPAAWSSPDVPAQANAPHGKITVLIGFGCG